MAQVEQPGAYPWERFWVPAGERPTMHGGYFVEPASPEEFRWLMPESNGVSLASLRTIPCLVLLGDMGMGKSTTIEEEYRHFSLSKKGEKHEVLLRDLKRLTEEQIYRQVFGHPAVEGWRRGEHGLTLFLDSMDECWRRIDELETVLVGELERAFLETKSPFFLRVTCRSAEWRGHVGDAFKRLFKRTAGELEPVQMFTLAPLSERNIRQAAEFRGRNGDELVRRIAESQAQALASHPITFRMLFRIYTEGGCFPGSRVDLYEQGCRELCADQHSVFGSTLRRTTTPEQRFVLASRVAAVSVLTNKYLISGSQSGATTRPDVLEIRDLFGYFDEETAGQRVTSNQATLTEVLQTALFGEMTQGAQNWRHQSYAEFLAARYLAKSRLSAEQIVSLITDTSDNAQRLCAPT